MSGAVRFNLTLACFFVAACFAPPHLLGATEKKTKPKVVNPEQTEQESINVKFDDEQPPVDTEKTAPQISEIFKNPALVSGIASGADAINRSIESLMQSLFYGLLDNEVRYPLTAHSGLALGLARDVYSAANGAYVVVDRLNFGPRYNRELWRIDKLPVVLGADGTIDVVDIYLRTDGMRVAEQTDMPYWRVALNNWFGLLPLLASVLPPSFNSNEMYDPLRQAEVPFVFPFSMDSFNAMPIGSIRSYGVSGGVNLGIDLGAFGDQQLRDILTRAEGLAQAVPYSIFRQGQHRINVLKRGSHLVWVGLSKLSRFGHSLSPGLGKTLLLFKNVLPLWPGMNLAMYPVDVKLEQAYSNRFDQLYEYDLRKKEAQEAYLAAVKGNFEPSWARHLDQREKKLDTGVVFHFTKGQIQHEDLTHNSRNLAVERKTRNQERTDAEVEITDQDGKFHVLEAKQEIADEHWDLLVGSEESTYRDQVRLKVSKVISNKPNATKDDYSFEFGAEKDPIQLTMTLSIQDRYTTTEEYKAYVEALRFFTGLGLDDIPEFPLRDSDEQATRRRTVYFQSVLDPPLAIHVTPTTLGRFGAQAAVSFSTAVLDEISKKGEDDFWRAFALAFGVPEANWRTRTERQGFLNQANWVKSLVVYPLRLLNMRFAWADAVKEATHSIKALAGLRSAQTPMEKRDAFFALFDTDYPQILTRALLNLTDIEKIPRSASLSSQSKGAAPPSIKQKFTSLNGRVYKSAAPFPAPERYRIAEDKLAAFFPGSVREMRRKPVILNLEVAPRLLPFGAKPIDPEEGAVDPTLRHVSMRLQVRNMDPGKAGRIYVRFEQSGKIQFGKLALAEKVLELSALGAVDTDPAGLEKLDYETFLTGPISPLRNFIFDRALGLGGEFKVSVSASSDGTIWSDEKSVKFIYENGKLYPPSAN